MFIRTALLFACLLAMSEHGAAAPALLTYQGRVVADGVNFTGNGRFKFALVDAAGTTTYWSNDGTSVAGSSPSEAVILPVERGYYSVLLGDSTISNMIELTPTVLQHDDVRLRVWFDDGIHGYERLVPDQRVSAAAYALVAESVRDGAITTVDIADASTLGRALLTQATTTGVRSAIGLGNVSNTSDAEKPLSLAVQSALGTKLDITQVGVAGGVAAQDATEIRARRPRQALSKIAAISSGVAQLRVLTFGDSMAGLGGTGFPSQLMAELEKAYGRIGTGTWPNMHVAGAASAGNSSDYTYWPSGGLPYTESGGSLTYGRYGAGALADTIKIYYVKSAGAGSFQIQTAVNTFVNSPDGANWVVEPGYEAVSAVAPDVGLGVITLNRPLHNNVVLRVVGVNGRVYFLPAGCGQFRATTVSGVESLSVARGGLSLRDANRSSQKIFSEWLADAAPDIGFFEMKESSATLSADIALFQNRVRSGAPMMDWVFILSTPTGMNNNDQIDQNDILKAHALAGDYGVLDFYRLYGSYLDAKARGYMADGVHRTELGNKILVGFSLEQLGINASGAFTSTRLTSKLLSTSMLSVSGAGGSLPLGQETNAVRIEPDVNNSDAKITSVGNLNFYNGNGGLAMRIALSSDFSVLPSSFMVGNGNLFLQGGAGEAVSVRRTPYGSFGDFSASNVSVYDGDLFVRTSGKTLRIKEGSNASAGVVTLGDGTARVFTTAVTSKSRIKLTPQSLGTIARPAAVGVTARAPGVSFTIMSSAANDTSVIYWEIMEPAP